MARKRSKALGAAQSMTPAMPIADVLDASAFGIEDIVTTPSSIPKPVLQMPAVSGPAPTLKLPSLQTVINGVHSANTGSYEYASSSGAKTSGYEDLAAEQMYRPSAEPAPLRGNQAFDLRGAMNQSILADDDLANQMANGREAAAKARWDANIAEGDEAQQNRRIDKAMERNEEVSLARTAQKRHDARHDAADKRHSARQPYEVDDIKKRWKTRHLKARPVDIAEREKERAIEKKLESETIEDVSSDVTPSSGYEDYAEQLLKKKRIEPIKKRLKDRASKLYLGGGFKNASRQWDAMDAFDKANMMRTGKAYGQALENIKKSGTENAATNNMVASLQAAKEAGVSDGEIFSGGKQLGSDLARQMGLEKSAGKQLSKDLETAKNAMTTLEAEQKRAHKAYDGIIEAVGDKKKWASMTNAQKAGAIGMHAKQAIRLNESMSGRFGRTKSLFGKVVDRIGSVKTAIANRGQGLSLRQEAAMSYHSRQLRRAKKAINSNEKLGSVLDAIGRRKAARGERVIGATDKAIEDLKARNYRSAQMINDIKNGKSARGVVQRANPEMMKHTVAEGPKGGKGLGGKGLGWKSKAGAVGGLLALGAVLGSMMGGHGEQSNAQLYNPNPQPQYAN